MNEAMDPVPLRFPKLWHKNEIFFFKHSKNCSATGASPPHPPLLHLHFWLLLHCLRAHGALNVITWYVLLLTELFIQLLPNSKDVAFLYSLFSVLSYSKLWTLTTYPHSLFNVLSYSKDVSIRKLFWVLFLQNFAPLDCIFLPIYLFNRTTVHCSVLVRQH